MYVQNVYSFPYPILTWRLGMRLKEKTKWHLQLLSVGLSNYSQTIHYLSSLGPRPKTLWMRPGNGTGLHPAGSAFVYTL